MKDTVYSIGTIIGTHALKGEVKVFSITDFREERYKKGNTVMIETSDGMKELTIKSHRVHKGNDLLLFEGYNSINDVLQFIKCKVYVTERQLHKLEEDEYYYHQLIGCMVKTDDKEVGIVKDVTNYGASDLLIIEEDQGEIMIPFVNEFIVDVDLEKKEIIIDPIEGMLGE